MKHMDDLQTDGFVTKKYKYALNTRVIINNNNQVENAGDGAQMITMLVVIIIAMVTLTMGMVMLTMMMVQHENEDSEHHNSLTSKSSYGYCHGFQGDISLDYHPFLVGEDRGVENGGQQVGGLKRSKWEKQRDIRLKEG